MTARVYELGTKLELFAPASATPYEGAHLTVHGEKSWVTLAGDSLSIADDKGSPRATVGTTGLVTKATARQRRPRHPRYAHPHVIPDKVFARRRA